METILILFILFTGIAFILTGSIITRETREIISLLETRVKSLYEAEIRATMYSWNIKKIDKIIKESNKNKEPYFATVDKIKEVIDSHHN